MKRRLVKYVTGACVAGLVAGMPAIADAAPGGAEGSEAGVWAASENMNIALYGPPSTFDPGEQPIQVLYGPPEIIERMQNPMEVTVANKAVRESKLAEGRKSFPKAIVVKKAKGALSFSRVDSRSSKKLTVNKKTGVVSVKKGTKKGVYKIVVQVRAEGNDAYAPAIESVTVKVRVK